MFDLYRREKMAHKEHIKFGKRYLENVKVIVQNNLLK